MKWALLLVGLALGLAAWGCKKQTETESAKSDAGGATPAAVPRVEREAQEAAVAEIGKHWSKGADGWTTAVTSGTPVAPDHLLRQFRELTVHGVETVQLDDSDRANGLEWAGKVWFSEAPYREAGDQGVLADGQAGRIIMRQPGHWTQWTNFQPEALRVQKVKGVWQITQDTFLLRGRVPQAQDFSNAGVH